MVQRGRLAQPILDGPTELQGRVEVFESLRGIPQRQIYLADVMQKVCFPLAVQHPSVKVKRLVEVSESPVFFPQTAVDHRRIVDDKSLQQCLSAGTRKC